MKVTAERHLFRRYLTHAEFVPMLSRLRPFAQNASFVRESGKYHIRTLYFGRQRMRMSRSRQSRLVRIDQYYMRYYDYDLSTLRLCKRSVQTNRGYVAYTAISLEHGQRILAGDYQWMKEDKDNLIQEFYAKFTQEEYVTKNLIDSDKIVLSTETNLVEIAFEINIRTTNRATGFFLEKLNAQPLDASRTLVLNVRYQDHIPEPIRSIVGYGQLHY